MALRHLDPDTITQNPDNPRLVFREQEMNQLLESIQEVGIKVPLSVYQDGKKFVLIDGERRWRCARRLNMDRVPALVEPKPTRLQNILTMFNIHNVRVDWDLMPMALKLADVRELLDDEGLPSAPKDLSAITGVPLSTVRRALELLELPAKYRRLLLSEAAKPRDQQLIKADLFVEINKSMRAIENYVPEVFEKVSRHDFVDSMVSKYRSGVVNNVVKFRDISRMARAERAGEDTETVIPTLVTFVRRPSITIDDVYERTVADAYKTRDLSSRVVSLTAALSDLTGRSRVSRAIREPLIELKAQIDRLLAR